MLKNSIVISSNIFWSYLGKEQYWERISSDDVLQHLIFCGECCSSGLWIETHFGHTTAQWY
jgi:hypothetical protein